ncbi:MAG: hypothetical protein ACOCSJ_04840 [Candidatus Natronoplasma sp.]
MGKNKGKIGRGEMPRFLDDHFGIPEIDQDEKKNVKEPLKVLKKDDRKIGILKNGSGYYLRDFDRDQSYGCYTVEYPSLKLAERDARHFLRKDEEVVTAEDVGFCSSCEGSQCSFMVNCEDWKSNQVMKAIKRRTGG